MTALERRAVEIANDLAPDDGDLCFRDAIAAAMLALAREFAAVAVRKSLLRDRELPGVLVAEWIDEALAAAERDE